MAPSALCRLVGTNPAGWAAPYSRPGASGRRRESSGQGEAGRCQPLPCGSLPGPAQPDTSPQNEDKRGPDSGWKLEGPLARSLGAWENQAARNRGPPPGPPRRPWSPSRGAPRAKPLTQMSSCLGRTQAPGQVLVTGLPPAQGPLTVHPATPFNYGIDNSCARSSQFMLEKPLDGFSKPVSERSSFLDRRPSTEDGKQHQVSCQLSDRVAARKDGSKAHGTVPGREDVCVAAALCRPPAWTRAGSCVHRCCVTTLPARLRHRSVRPAVSEGNCCPCPQQRLHRSPVSGSLCGLGKGQFLDPRPCIRMPRGTTRTSTS